MTRLEARFHGRGGQGTVTLAALFVDAAFSAGRHALGFPSFGTERTGAPVVAFARISSEPIRDRSQVTAPGLVVVQDASLMTTVDVVAGITPGGLVVVNAPEMPPALRAHRAVAIDVAPAARRHLGATITSTAMLAATMALTGIASIDDVCAAIERRFRGDTATRNVALAREVFALAESQRSAA